MNRLQARAFTFVELSIGLVVAGTVMLAATTFMLTTAANWKAADAGTSLQVADFQVHSRLQNQIRGAALLGAVRPGSLTDSSVATAAILIWARDGNAYSSPVVAADGKVQDGEIVMLEYNASTKTINQYVSSTTGSTRTWAAMENTPPDQFAAFKSGKTAVPLIKNVAACTFNRVYSATSTALPLFEYHVKISRSDTTTSVVGKGGVSDLSGTIVVRAPKAQPTN